MEVNVIDFVGKYGYRGRYARSGQKRRLKSHVGGRATSRGEERWKWRVVLTTALGGDGDGDEMSPDPSQLGGQGTHSFTPHSTQSLETSRLFNSMKCAETHSYMLQ
jgi:hypothetical protein